MWSDTLRSVILAELTVPWEANIEWAHERKATKYLGLKNQIEDNGWKCHVYPVEVGCCSFVGQSTLEFLNAMGVAPRIRQATIRKLKKMAETASAWIWNSLEPDENWQNVTWLACTPSPTRYCYHSAAGTAHNCYWNRPRKEVWVPAEDGGWWAGSPLYVGYGCVRLFCNLGNIDSETAPWCWFRPCLAKCNHWPPRRKVLAIFRVNIWLTCLHSPKILSFL